MPGSLWSLYVVSAGWGWLVEAEGFWLEYVDGLGELHSGPFEAMWSTRFEAAGQARMFPSYRGSATLPVRIGLLPVASWWASSGGWSSVS